MKSTRFSLLFVLLGAFCNAAGCLATVVTFDSISETATGTFIPNGYQGLNWSNFWCFNSILATNRPEVGVSGFYYGMVSASNVAYNPLGNPVEIDARGTNFNFLSAYFTGAWHSNLSIEVEGFRAGNLIYDQTVIASATSPTLFTFGYTNIDRLYFNSFGGQPAFPSDGGNHFVMDNFTFEFVPEPSALLLTGGSLLMLLPLFRRRLR